MSTQYLDKNYPSICLSSPHMSDEGYEQDFIQQAFQTNWIAPLGFNVDQFEMEICEYTGAKYAVALSSGTAAIHLGLKYLGVGRGDIVFCPTLTFCASANPIIYEGAVPVFIDCDYETWNISPDALEKAFKKYPKAKALITVNLFGQSADYDRIRQIASQYQCPILEDAAESLGGTYKGRQTGTFGDIGIYSFNGNKIITTSGGGMLVSDNPDAIRKVKFWATQSRANFPYYHHEEIGYNYRLSNVLAGIGRGQLRIINQRIAKKKYIYEFYKKAFDKMDDIEMMPIGEYGEPNYWLSCLTLKKDSSTNPQEIINALSQYNIEARYIWKPLHRQPIFRDCDFIATGDYITIASEDIFKRGLCLPSDTKMTTSDLNRIVGTISGILNKNINLKEYYAL